MPLSICEALRKGTQELKLSANDLIPANELQEQFITTQYIPYLHHRMYEYFPKPELIGFIVDSHAGTADYQEQTANLKAHGFNVHVGQAPVGTFGLGAWQKINIKWRVQVAKTTITSADTTYAGMYIQNHVRHKQVRFFTKPDNAMVVIVELLARNKDKVYLATKRDGDFFEHNPDDITLINTLKQYQNELHNGTYTTDTRYSGVKFPTITYEEEFEVEWLGGLKIGENCTISHALQKISFTMVPLNMNDIGAQFSDGANAADASPAKIVDINKPFLVWIERPGVPLPIFAGYMPKKYWSAYKEPVE